jgi:nucleoside phosphorylase
MLCIKVGMSNEYDIADSLAAPGVQVIKGVMTVADLQKAVQPECKAIMSFGMAGGIRPRLPVVGQQLIASKLIAPNGDIFLCDEQWVKRLFFATKYYVQPFFSSGEFNTANTPLQRKALFDRYQAQPWAIDDESLAVAQFAAARHIPFVIYRNISDAWDDDVSITGNILTATGDADPLKVLQDTARDPESMVRVALHYATSNHMLELAAQQVAPNFGWVDA